MKRMHLFVPCRIATKANTVETILHGSVGLLTARSGGHLLSLQCYVSPYDIFEEGTGAQLNFTDTTSELQYFSRTNSVLRSHLIYLSTLYF